MHTVFLVVLLGAGATAVMDLWGIIREPLFGLPRADYALIGRWFGHMPRGRFRHEAIARAPAVAYERPIGWVMHYAIGVTFAALLIAIEGVAWFARPTLLPALLVGVATVAGPLLVMQPGMGAGIAGARTPRPWRTRLQALLGHLVYGSGLYVSGWVVHLLLSR